MHSAKYAKRIAKMNSRVAAHHSSYLEDGDMKLEGVDAAMSDEAPHQNKYEIRLYHDNERGYAYSALVKTNDSE